MIAHDTNPPPASQPICKKIDNYIFKFADLLGQGNFSKVYKAYHETTNDIVAIKIIELNSLKSKKLEELLFSEIDILKKLNHPNILQCYEIFTSNRNCYIITEICNGGDLQTKLRKQHHFSEENAEPIIRDIFAGLLYLSSQNIIHRDLKVANVFVHNGRGKIADFGFAKFTKQNFTDINIGSPLYMAPEGLIHNKYGPKTDVWAFGILIFELLHGETPFATCRTQAQLRYHVSRPILSNTFRIELSPQVKQVMSLCLEIDESKRVSFQQLQNLAYFQRIMKQPSSQRMQQPEIRKKASSKSQQGFSGVSKNLIDQHNFLVPNEDKVSDRQIPIPQRHNSSINPSTNKSLNFMTKNETTALSKQQVPIQKIAPSLKSPSNIFSTSITFQECVNILHYCRLNYKFVVQLRQSSHFQENTVNLISEWVLVLIDEIKLQISSNGIIYEGDNAKEREKKLREVTNQYTKKYQKELYAVKNPNLTPQIVKNYSYSEYNKIDAKISMRSPEQVLLVLGHYIVMIYYGTTILKQCYEEHNYKPINKFKQIEQLLRVKRDKMDLQAYRLIKRKVRLT